jgi:hypothetical protein
VTADGSLTNAVRETGAGAGDNLLASGIGNSTSYGPPTPVSSLNTAASSGANGIIGESPMTTSSDGPPSPFPPTQRLLELQLMHRWSTITYKSMVSPPADDDYVWQTQLPSWALRHGYLMDGLLALTAFEMANAWEVSADCSDPSGGWEGEMERYIQAATEYQDSALAAFRLDLHGCENSDEAVTAASDDHQMPPSDDFAAKVITYEPILAFSMLLMCLAFASARVIPHYRKLNPDSTESPSMVNSTLMHMRLLEGCATILTSMGDKYLTDNPYIAKLTLFENLPAVPLPPTSPTARMLTKLHEVNERRLTSSMLLLGESYDARVKLVAKFETCKKAIVLLAELFAKCAVESGILDVRRPRGPKAGGGHAAEPDAEVEGVDYQGYLLGWLNYMDPGYIEAIENGDIVALLVLMVWGAVLEKLGGRVWWARGFGGLLVHEIAGRVAIEEAPFDGFGSSNGNELVQEVVTMARAVTANRPS